MKKQIPNIITSLNLLCGCIAIVQAFENNLVLASWFVVLAAVLDFFDGMAARLLHVKSVIGKELDSLADMVSFGVVPGIIMFHLLGMSIKDSTMVHKEFIQYVAFLIPVFSAFRLAKFNIDTRQTESFIGLPTPANTLFVISFPLILFNEFPSLLSADIFRNIILNTNFLIIFTLIASYLLVSPLPLFALKFKDLKWNNNKVRFIFLILSAILFLMFYYIAIPFILILYIILSIINNNIKK